MGSKTVVGSAAVAIVPSMNGFAKQVDKQLSGAAGECAAKFSNVFAKGAGGAGSAGAKAASGFTSAFAAKMGAVTGVVQSAVSSACSAVSSSLESAISRVDTMAAFPRVMSGLGYSADDASAAVQSMSDHLAGLPTRLDAMTSSVQKIVPTVKDVGKSTDIMLAFNDALLAGGASTQVQEAALEQFSQVLAKGKPELEDWRSIQTAMPGQLDQVAKSMLGASASSNDLYTALKEGTVSVEDLEEAFISLDKDGYGGFDSFAEQAKNGTAGIATSFANMQNAVTKSVAKCIEAVGSSRIAGAIQAIGSAVSGAGALAADGISSVVGYLTDLYGALEGNGAVQAFSELMGQAADAMSAIGSAAVDAAKELWGFDGSQEGVQSAADAIKRAIDDMRPAMQWLKDNAPAIGRGVALVATAFASFKIASGIAAGIKGVASAVSSIAGKALAAAGGLTATAAAETAAGTAAGASAKQMLAAAAAIVAIGAGVLLACAGLSMLSSAAVSVAQAGTPAAIALAAMTAAVALLAVGAAAIGPALTAGALGLVAFGAAVALVGVGVLAACAGLSMLASALPTVSEYGTSAAAGILAVSGAALALSASVLAAAVAVVAMAAGIAVAAVALLALGGGALLASAGVAALAAAISLAAGGVGLVAAAFTALAAAVSSIADGVCAAADGFASMAGAMPTVAESGAGAAAGLGLVGTAALAANGSIQSAGSAMHGLSGGASAACSSCGSVSAAMLAASASSVALSAAVSAMCSAAASSCSSMASKASASFDSFAQSARAAGASAVSAISSACASMRAQVSGLKLTLPRISVGALPHFSMSGSFDAKTGSVPSVNVSWYASGGLFGRPSLIGVGDNRRYDEAVLPLSPSVLEGIGDGVASRMGERAESAQVNNYNFYGDLNAAAIDRERFAEEFVALLYRWNVIKS